MLIKFCPVCMGKPYTTDLNENICPMCGAELTTEMVPDSTLDSRQKLNSPVFNDTFSNKGFGEITQFGTENNDFTGFTSSDEFGNSEPFGQPFNTPEVTPEEQIFPFDNPITPLVTHENNEHNDSVNSAVLTSKDGMSVVGKLTRYSKADEDSGYKRLFIGKIIDAIFYKQRMEDVLHRFTVRVDCGKDALGHNEFKDIPVNVHGVIASGLQLDENCDVEVKGKYKNNVLMASEINVLNSGFKSKVHFQHSRGAIAYGILAIIALIFFIYVGLSSDGGFFANIKEFFVVWLVSAVVITILYFALFLSKLGVLLLMGKKKSFPFVGILLCSFICALLFMNVFGLGTSVGGLFSGWLSSIMPIIITIIALIVVVCLVVKR